MDSVQTRDIERAADIQVWSLDLGGNHEQTPNGGFHTHTRFGVEIS